jgi:DNA replicative helicase MCM subunit Mcm2 (Cdc46/Mcm family)
MCAVSSINAVCSGSVKCACDASKGEHERPCGYRLQIDCTEENNRPPTPVTISIFDTGNGRPSICPKCKGKDFQVKIEYRRAKLIKLQDVDNRTDNARQDVVLYDDWVDNLVYSEIVQVEGTMHVERKPGSAKNSMMDNILHASSIKYLKRKEVVITPKDKEIFYEWKEECDRAYTSEIEALNLFQQQARKYNCLACRELARKIIPLSFVERQAAAFAPNVVGNAAAKEGCLRTLVGAVPRGPGRLAGKIHTLFVGEKGTAKSKLGEEAKNILPNSTHVSGPHASTKTITGIVDEESRMLLLGVVPTSDIVIIDEINKFPREEQGRLLDILEEQHFTKDAHGRHYEVEAQAAIIATSNPTNSNWIDRNKISKDEIDILDPLRDRFSQIFTFRDDNDTIDKRRNFAKKMGAILKHPPPNYSFFRKFWIYASSLKPAHTPTGNECLTNFGQVKT